MKDVNMKIVILGTLTNKMNGSARSFHRLVNLLSFQHEVFPIVPDQQGIGVDLNKTNHRTLFVNYGPLRRSFKSLLSLPASFIKLKKAIKNINPDHIHINDIPWFYVIWIAKSLKIPVTIHSRFFEQSRFVRKIIKNIISKADGIIYVSEYNKNLWGINDDKNKNFTLHNPGVFDCEFQDGLAEKIPQPYMLIVSRISEDKGILEALKVFADFCTIDNEIKLVVAGGTQYEYQSEYLNICKKYVEKLGLSSRVYWLGEVDKPHALYKHSSCFLHLPNFEDPFPTTIMESLSLGCRIITRKKGGIPEQIKGFDGVLLVDPLLDNSKIVADFLKENPMFYDRKPKYEARFHERVFTAGFEKILSMIHSVRN